MGLLHSPTFARVSLGIVVLSTIFLGQTSAAQDPPLTTAPAETGAASAPPAATTPVKAATDLKSIVTICPSIRTRITRDHRIRLSEERFKGEKRVHIFLYMSEQPLPYVVSLGWFSTREDTTPLEQEKPKTPGKFFHKKQPLQATTAKTNELLTPKFDATKPIVAVDELGLVLPNLKSGPRDKNYDKADWKTVLGFDLVGDNDLEGAENQFSDAIKIAPVNARFSNNLGAVLAARGRYSEATSHFDRAIREKEDFAAAHSNRALLSLAIGQPGLAIDDAVKALKLDPSLIPARVAYGRALLETGKTDDAMKVAQALKTDAPDEWQSMLLYADTLLAAKEYKDSKGTLARLAVLSPGNADIVMKLAHANEKLGDLDEAIKQARKATQLAPNDVRTHITLGRYLDANRDANAARLQFERAMELKPDKAMRKAAMGAMLRLLIQSEKLPDADEWSKKWVKDYPDDAVCHYNRAWIASQLEGDHAQECIDAYRKALELDASLTSVHYNLALVLIKAGKNADALKELKSFVSACPEDSDTASALELIKKLEGNG